MIFDARPSGTFARWPTACAVGILLASAFATSIALAQSKDPPQVNSTSSGGTSVESRTSTCRRYSDWLSKPAVQERLEAWFDSLPKSLDRTTLPRSNRFPGIGVYSLPLGFDPSEIGFTDHAEARVSLHEDNTISALYITDTRGTMYTFLVGDNRENFLRSTLDRPRGQRVGVMCLGRD